jgi:hypothetical protein
MSHFTQNRRNAHHRPAGGALSAIVPGCINYDGIAGETAKPTSLGHGKWQIYAECGWPSRCA